MRYLSILFLIYSGIVLSSEQYVYIAGDNAYSDINIENESICVDGSQYVAKRTSGNPKAFKIKIESRKPWEKIGFVGKCSGIQSILAKDARLSEDASENVDLMKGGAKEFAKSKLPSGMHVDSNMKKFYMEIQSPNFQPGYKAITRKWPLNSKLTLIEQCLRVTAVTKSYPGNSRTPFTYAEKYTRKIVSQQTERKILDTGINFITSHCECDEPQFRACNLIDKLGDLNGNGKYDYVTYFRQPEGSEIKIHEFTGKNFEVIHRICTGEVAFPYGSFKCP